MLQARRMTIQTQARLDLIIYLTFDEDCAVRLLFLNDFSVAKTLLHRSSPFIFDLKRTSNREHPL